MGPHFPAPHTGLAAPERWRSSGGGLATPGQTRPLFLAVSHRGGRPEVQTRSSLPPAHRPQGQHQAPPAGPAVPGPWPFSRADLCPVPSDLQNLLKAYSFLDTLAFLLVLIYPSSFSSTSSYSSPFPAPIYAPGCESPGEYCARGRVLCLRESAVLMGKNYSSRRVFYSHERTVLEVEYCAHSAWGKVLC